MRIFSGTQNNRHGPKIASIPKRQRTPEACVMTRNHGQSCPSLHMSQYFTWHLGAYRTTKQTDVSRKWRRRGAASEPVQDYARRLTLQCPKGSHHFEPCILSVGRMQSDSCLRPFSDLKRRKTSRNHSKNSTLPCPRRPSSTLHRYQCSKYQIFICRIIALSRFLRGGATPLAVSW